VTEVRLDGTDLPASLVQAQAGLTAAAAGSAHVWLVPHGTFDLGTTTLGAPGRDLTLAGVAPGPAPTLRVTGPAGLTVTGAQVAVRGLVVQAAVDDGPGLVVVGDDVHVGGVEARGRGRSVVALDVTAARTAQVLGTTLDADATVGDATGLRVEAGTVRVHRVEVGPVTARGAATGVHVAAVGPLARASVSRVHAAGVAGAQADGVVVTAGTIADVDPGADVPPPAALAVVDVAVEDVRARSGPACAVRVRSAGAAQVRGVGVGPVRGTAAAGVDVLAGGQVEVAGASVRAVTGEDDGAVGVRVRASASAQPLVVDDVHVEQVTAADRPQRVRGVEVAGVVDEDAPWLDDATDAGPVRVTGCVLRRVSGTALLVDADLRDVEVRGVETWTAARAASVRGERVLLAESTWHRTGTGVEVGPCTLTLVDALVTGVVTGPALVLDPQTEVAVVAAAYGERPDAGLRLSALPTAPALPYVDPGPAGVPDALGQGRFVPTAAVDLRLSDDAVHALAVPVPGDGDGRTRQVGAQPPAAAPVCDLRDPLEVPQDPPEPPAAPGPVIDRTAKDARGLLAVMRARAAGVLPGWVPTDAADLTTTLLELVAHRLDRIGYRQDDALTEAYLLHARRRRSVEEHARLVDYRPDPGLTSTTMLDVVVREDAHGVEPFVLGAGSLVVNPDATQDPVLVATETDLVHHPSLARVALLDDVRAGATSARLAGDLVDLAPGRWLVLAPVDPRASAHVVRATVVEVGTDETLVRWDPRRPVPRDLPAGATVVLGNVVPAHHGLTVPYPRTDDAADPGLAAQLAEVEAQLVGDVVGGGDVTVEVPVPLAPVSRVAPGWPLPGQPPRDGRAQVGVTVDDEPWRAVDDVATEPGEVFALAAEADGSTRVVLGQPGTLPGRPVRVRLAARLGGGVAGNVAAHTLTSLVAVGPGTTGLAGGASLDAVRAAVSVDNPVPGVEGRDPEPLDRIRRRAPWVARSLVTAVTADDHARLLEELPEVAAARARVVELGERRLVRVTLLLAGEDTLVPGRTDGAPGGADDARGGLLDPVRDAERLRRWALARHRLEDVRLLGVDVQLVPPTFVPVDLDVVVDAHPWAPAEQVHHDVTAVLEGDGGLFDPDTLGLGGDVHVDAVLRRALAVPGVAAAHVRRLRRAVPGAPEHAVDGTLPVGDEEVAVLRPMYGNGPRGLLTIEVCGGTR